MIYDINCPRCRVKMEFYFIHTADENLYNNEWHRELIEFDLAVDKIIYDRLA